MYISVVSCICFAEMKLSGSHGLLSQSLPVRSESDIISSSSFEQEDLIPVGEVSCTSRSDVSPSETNASCLTVMDYEQDIGDVILAPAGEGHVEKRDGKKDSDVMDVWDDGEDEDVLEAQGDDDMMKTKENSSGDLTNGDGDDKVSDRLTEHVERGKISLDVSIDSQLPECLGSFSYHSPVMMSSPVKSKPDRVEESEMNRRMNSNLTSCKEELTIAEDEVCSTPKKDSIIIEVDTPRDTSCSVEPERAMEFDLEAISNRLKSLSCGGKITTESSIVGDMEGCRQGRSRFRAKIDPGSNVAAEDELSREIK